MKQSHWTSLVSAAVVSVLVGFPSTVLVAMEGLKAVGANPAQQASAIAALCFAMAGTGAVLAYVHKQPITMAWSTPGAALLATSAAGVSFPSAVGAFLLAAVLMMLTALFKPIANAINKIPASIAAAMLAGVLLRYVLGVPAAALELPVMVFPLVVVFFGLRLLSPKFAVPVVVGLGVILAAFSGNLAAPIQWGVTPLVFVAPKFELQVLLSIGLPLYLVTMASQNLPGFAVLKANGYEPPVQSSLMLTGLGSAVSSFFGGHAVNMAAITAAITAGPDCHPDPTQRWKMVFPYSILYLVVGLFAGSVVSALGALPQPLVVAIAGLALFAPLSAGLMGMTKDLESADAAIVTFLVTASGLTVFGVGSAFWGLLLGLGLWLAKRSKVLP